MSAGKTLAQKREFEFDDEDFQFVARLVKEKTGIVLADHKRDMVYGRLARRLRTLGMTDFKAYTDMIQGPAGDKELGSFVNALTTNLTKFFRENHHFEHLSNVALPEVKARQKGADKKRLRIWSAGSSSGEEPYSIAMTVQNALPSMREWDARILATDIDTDMLTKGSRGIYEKERAENIPDAYRAKFAENLPDGGIQLKPNVREMISFKRLNLLGKWPMKGPFDVIFCRNVVIYFDKPTQKVLFDRYAELLHDDGVLYVGHSENLFNVTDRFKLIERSTYKKTY